MPVGVKRLPLSYVARPRLSGMRAAHSRSPTLSTLPLVADRGRRYKSRKTTGPSRFDHNKKGNVLDYTDTAYKEAVSKLKSMLNDNYIPPQRHHTHVRHEESDEESGLSVMLSDTTRVAKFGTYRKPSSLNKHIVSPKFSPVVPEASHFSGSSAPPELIAFIERQEEYIEQLERESQYCRDELSQLLTKTKELIAENDNLHEQRKSCALRHGTEDSAENRRYDAHYYEEPEPKLKVHLEGPAIVYESRISELEAQLTQARLDLKKSQEENLTSRRQVDGDPITPSPDFYRQMEVLQREKRELNESLNKLQAAIAQMREKESDTARRVQRSQDVAEKAQIDRQQAEMEVQRLKTELDHQHERLLDVLSEQTRKVADERNQAERRYHQHVESLSAELASQRDATMKLQLELERHIRTEDDLRRDLAAKNITIESVRKELNGKIGSVQSELTTVLTERDALEQELNTNKMSGERSERVSRQEASRLQVEVNALRQRIERSDTELIHARRENLRLAEQVSAQENEIALYKMRLEDKVEPNEKEEEEKRAQTVRELEGLVEKQSHAMSLLTNQCHSLAQKLDVATARHKQEMADLQSNIEFLTNRLETSSRQWVPSVLENQPYQHNFESQPSDFRAPDEVTNGVYSSETYHPVIDDRNNLVASPSYEQQQLVMRASSPSRTRVTPPAGTPEPTNITRPALSRSSSRGDRSESPSMRRDQRRSPLQRKESRMGVQQSPTRLASPPRANVYSPDSAYQPQREQPYYGNDQNPYNVGEYIDPNEYSQHVQQENSYLPESMHDYDSQNKYNYDTHHSELNDSRQYEYTQPMNITESSDPKSSEPYYQTQDGFKHEVETLRNRTPSRESLRNIPESPKRYQRDLTESLRRLPSAESPPSSNIQQQKVHSSPQQSYVPQQHTPPQQQYMTSPQHQSPPQQQYVPQPPTQQQQYVPSQEDEVYSQQPSQQHYPQDMSIPRADLSSEQTVLPQQNIEYESVNPVASLQDDLSADVPQPQETFPVRQSPTLQPKPAIQPQPEQQEISEVPRQIQNSSSKKRTPESSNEANASPSLMRAQQKFQSARQHLASSNESLNDGQRTKLPPPSTRKESNLSKNSQKQIRNNK